MINVPAENTTQHLKRNELLCYYCGGINCQLYFDTFRLYLPSFPREDINAIIEIPFYLARQFALSLENYFSNSLDMIFVSDNLSNKLSKCLRRDRSPKFLVVCGSSTRCNDTENTNANLLKFNKTEYVIKNLKDWIGSIKVEVFRNVSSMSMKILIENCKSILEFQNARMIRLVGCIQFANANLFIRITENCCMDLGSLHCICVREREVIDQDSKIEVSLFILAEVLLALDYLHERGITHRQLSPKRILFDLNGHLKIGGIFEAMNGCRDIMHLYENWSPGLEKDVGFTNNLNQFYLDPEVLRCLLNDKTLEAHTQLDILSDIFSVAVMIVETLSGVNLLDINTWTDVYSSMFLPASDYFYLVEIFLNPQMQMILRQRLTELCGYISSEFYAFLLLMLQPKSNRMRGLRIHVQRHRFLNNSGCEYKLRMDLVKRHSVFGNIDMNVIFLKSSPIVGFLSYLNNT